MTSVIAHQPPSLDTEDVAVSIAIDVQTGLRTTVKKERDHKFHLKNYFKEQPLHAIIISGRISFLRVPSKVMCCY